MSEREIFHGTSPVSGCNRSVCVDAVDGEIMMTTTDFRDDAQINLDLDAARRLGEWLIERANQAGER